MTRKPDFGALLEKFGDRPGKPDAKPLRRSKRFGPGWTVPKDIALPSLGRLLAIDAAAEKAANRDRIAAVLFQPIKATGLTHGTPDASDCNRATF